MKKIRYFFEALLLLDLLIISKILGVKLASAYGGWLGRTIGPHLAASRKAERNIRTVLPEKTNDEVKKIITGMWDNLGRIMMEYPHLKKITEKYTEISGIEHIPMQKGAISFTGHLANWEILPFTIFTKTGLKTTSIYRAPNNPFSDFILKRLRANSGHLSMIPKSKTGTRALVKALKDNRTVGILVDQKYNEGIEVDFLGQPAMTSPAFAQLAQKFNCPLIPTRVVRTHTHHFRVDVLPAVNIDNLTDVEIVEHSHKMLKEWILEHPEQWLWLHRRWKF